MFRKRARSNPEIVEAIKVRDELIEGVADAVAQVDRLKDEMLNEYIEAEEQAKRRRERRG